VDQRRGGGEDARDVDQHALPPIRSGDIRAEGPRPFRIRLSEIEDYIERSRLSAASTIAAVTKSTGEDWVGAPALARELGIMLRTLYKILDFGELPSYKLGRVIRIRRSDVEEYLESVRVRPGDLAHLYAPGENDQGKA
jgi:excisionase family DNA binding protein